MMGHLGTLLVLHVLGIGVLVGKFKLMTKPLWILATAVYFFVFYLAVGHWLASDPTRIIPEISLKNDFYWVPPKKLPTFYQDLPPMGTGDDGATGE